MLKYSLFGPYGSAVLLVEPYVGKKKSHTLMRAMSPDVMTKFADGAITRIYKVTGLSPNGMALRVMWDDEMKEFAATGTEVLPDGTPVQRVVFSVPHYLKMYGLITNVWQEFLHEFTHAVQRHAMGPNYPKVPQWWREGSAMYVAWPQGNVRAFAHYVLAACPISDMVTDLNPKEFGYVNYPESYYAVVLVNEKWGEEKIRQINHLLTLEDLPPFPQVIQDTLGISYDEFRKRAGVFARSRLENWIVLRAMSKAFKMK